VRGVISAFIVLRCRTFLLKGQVFPARSGTACSAAQPGNPARTLQNIKAGLFFEDRGNIFGQHPQHAIAQSFGASGG